MNLAQCTYCGIEVLAGRQIHNHVRAEHPETLEEFLLARKQDREENKRLKEKNNVKSNSKRKLLRDDRGKCNVCGKNSRLLRKHMRLCHGQWNE